MTTCACNIWSLYELILSMLNVRRQVSIYECYPVWPNELDCDSVAARIDIWTRRVELDAEIQIFLCLWISWLAAESDWNKIWLTLWFRCEHQMSDSCINLVPELSGLHNRLSRRNFQKQKNHRRKFEKYLALDFLIDEND